jgi:hypothetical protein
MVQRAEGDPYLPATAKRFDPDFQTYDLGDYIQQIHQQPKQVQVPRFVNFISISSVIEATHFEKSDMRTVQVLLALEFLLLPKALSFVVTTKSTVGLGRHNRVTQHGDCSVLHAAKLVYKWRVLPSGSLTGICDDGIITTSELKKPETAAPNALVVTASGSQYKLVGESIGGKKKFASSSTKLSDSSTDGTDSESSTAAYVTLFSAVGFFAVALIQKVDIFSLATIADSNISTSVSWRGLALVLYCVGVLIATIQLIDDAIKFAKK